MLWDQPMSESDLLRFLDKVDQLQQLVRSLDCDSRRRQALSACSDHNQVVALARDWGFDIGRRWGETAADAHSDGENLLSAPVADAGQEQHKRIQQGPGWHLDLISSNAFSNAADDWFDQTSHEWVLVLRGSATLELQDPYERRDLSVGDHLYLHPHRRHRLERTDPDPGTLWLALHWHV